MSAATQCPGNGCATRLLAHLRSQGVIFAVCNAELTAVAPPELPFAMTALQAHEQDFYAHGDRLIMLLWAEAGGLN